MGTSKAQPPSIPPESSAEQLDSWKEIAAYLKRDERTVRRWEAEGLPVHRHVHKKQASIYAYRTEVDAWWNNGRQRLEPTKPPRSRKQFLLWLMSGFVAAGLLGLLVYNASGLRKVRWARNQAVPEVAHLVDQGKAAEAFRLAKQAEQYIPDDPLLLRVMSSFTIPVSIQTAPLGADVYVRTYSSDDQGWTFLGKSPLVKVSVPWDYLRWRITKPGFQTIDVASGVLPNANLKFTLEAAGEGPTGMVHVPGGTFQFRSAAPVQLASYWLDKYEVTNRQFKEFVDRGGYQNHLNWKQPFIKDGRSLQLEEAMTAFRDSTGRPGPSVW